LIIQEYLERVIEVYKTGVATEHSYRSALEYLFHSLDQEIQALNEPKRVKCGAPDFIVNRGEIAIGHIEAKDIGIDLAHLKGVNVDQKKRYLKALPNLIYTNCLDFEFYRDGELLRRISIAEPLMGISSKPENFDELEHLLREFISQRPQTITSSQTLAEMMAGKAVLIKDVLHRALLEDDFDESELKAQFQAFQSQLIHDINLEDFADIYAETIAYGMFAARLHDQSLDNFSRQEALELLPKSNPFLRALFSYIAGPDLDGRIKWIIDDLANVFQACDVGKLMVNFGSLTQRKDPFLHFYETFLAAYNPKKRKARGVWYTPEPVVNFIVRAVDEVLKTEFGLQMGLADNSKITVDWDTGQKELTKKGTVAKSGKNATTKKEVHRVQILDPATGTGTFLAEVIKQIAPQVKGVAEGMWSQYIEKELVPRLHGFELLMASYAMCHMKLDMVLTEMGYKPTSAPPRLSVYLTNSLEEGDPANQTLPFAQWLSDEAKQANSIKRDMPIMCIIGNPPYSGHSSNNSDWINNLIEDYKRSAALKRPAQAKWLSDDYVKFIRFSEHMIEKNGEGILAFITNHGYLDNPTFMDMRLHLMETFDSIYVLDLHGNAKKKECMPNGTPDKNVFDIQQGVAIFVGIKKKGARAKGTAAVYHRHLWGTRNEKYEWLGKNTLNLAQFDNITPQESPWLFIPVDRELLAKYNSYMPLDLLMGSNGRPAPGMVTTHDQFAISWSEKDMENKIEKLVGSENEEAARNEYRLCTQDQWDYASAKAALSKGKWRENITQIAYRPFDFRYTIYDSNVAVHRRERVTRHMYRKQNYALLTTKATRDSRFCHVFVTNLISEAIFLSGTTASNAMVFPLYLYPRDDELDQTRRINFDDRLWSKLKAKASHPENGEPDEVATFDYIYGVLHCPDYRDIYKDFLKSGFPRIPYPESPDNFWHIVEKGRKLRQLHLMEDVAIGEAPYTLRAIEDAVCDNTVDTPQFFETSEGIGKVQINAGQYFENVPIVAWNFYIGGYQPAQKWLKDRKGRTLNFDDVRHYQKIIKILAETDRIMNEIKMPLN